MGENTLLMLAECIFFTILMSLLKLNSTAMRIEYLDNWKVSRAEGWSIEECIEFSEEELEGIDFVCVFRVKLNKKTLYVYFYPRINYKIKLYNYEN
jgi:hypothetical protein